MLKHARSAQTVAPLSCRLRFDDRAASDRNLVGAVLMTAGAGVGLVSAALHQGQQDPVAVRGQPARLTFHPDKRTPMLRKALLLAFALVVSVRQRSPCPDLAQWRQGAQSAGRAEGRRRLGPRLPRRRLHLRGRHAGRRPQDQRAGKGPGAAHPARLPQHQADGRIRRRHPCTTACASPSISPTCIATLEWSTRCRPRFWGKPPYPPRTMIEVQRLFDDDIVEIDTVFYAPRKN